MRLSEPTRGEEAPSQPYSVCADCHIESSEGDRPEGQKGSKNDFRGESHAACEGGAKALQRAL